MRIVLLPAGSLGGVHPFLGIGRALQSRGHDVTVITSGYYKELIDRAGLQAITFGTREDYLKVLAANPEITQQGSGLRTLAAVWRPWCADVVRLLQDSVATDDSPILVAYPLAFWARVARDALNVPLVTVNTNPSFIWSVQAPPVGKLQWQAIRHRPYPLKFLYVAAVNFVLDRALAPLVNDYCAAFGQPPVRRGIMRHWIHSPDRSIGLFPDWFAPPQSDWPAQMRLTGFPLFDESELQADQDDTEWEKWLAEGDPPVVLLAGTANSNAQVFFKACVEACGQLGRRVLVLTRFPEQLPAPLPPGALHVDYIPLGTVLPRAAAVVHHGGSGTLSQALRAGCPQLILPFNFDQPDHAVRLAQLGVGYYISPSRVTCGAVAESLDKLLRSSDIHDACRRVASRFEGVDGIAQTCDLIEALPGELRQSR